MTKNKIKLIIISDSHRSPHRIEEALSRARGCDGVVFLGDGLSDLELALPSRSDICYYAVRGNCDSDGIFRGAFAPKTAMTVLGGKKIVYTHGDLYGAKYGMGGLISLAKETGADIILFGHTHQRHEEYIDGVYYFNPGSIGSYAPSCGILTLCEGEEPLFSFMEL